MPPDTRPHLRLRLEPKLLERLEKARQLGRRTLTGEIAQRLTDSFTQEDISYAISGVETEVSLLSDAVGDGLTHVREELQQMRAELHHIRTELQELRRSVGAPPSTYLVPTQSQSPGGDK
jgi:hypothetical protein